jgi:hypothetical protein
LKPIKEMTQSELAAFVQSRLRENGIDVVLSGGACVAIYTRNKYVSLDLDMIEIYPGKKRVIRDSMNKMGFYEEGRHFKHPDSKFIIEFPQGPLSIGDEKVTQVVELDFSTGTLKLLSPTDCVKDRLAAFYHWGDKQCLAQAILVAQDHKIDLQEIKRWSYVEGKQVEFQKIVGRLEYGG